MTMQRNAPPIVEIIDRVVYLQSVGGRRHEVIA